jgi:hypothetical protein
LLGVVVGQDALNEEVLGTGDLGTGANLHGVKDGDSAQE